MPDPINVLMVTQFDPTVEAGGVNTMIRSLVRELGPRCRVVLLEARWDAPRPRRAMLGAVPHYALRLPLPFAAKHPVRGTLSWIASFPFTLIGLRRILRSERIDIAHLHYAVANHYVFALARRFLGVPYVTTLHRGDVMTYGQQDAAYRSLMRVSLRSADRVIGVSRWLAERARERFGEPPAIAVIPNGLDLAELGGLHDPDFAAKLPFPVPEDFVLMVSNVTRYKGQDVLIRAWPAVRARHPRTQLLIVGERRELWDECERLIAETGLGDAIRLLGAQPRALALDLMRRARAVVMPSRSEGLPYVLLEAGALGVPVVCSDIGPFTEVVEHDVSALVVPVEDVAAVASALDRLLADPTFARSLGQRLEARIRADFSAETMADRYLALYREVMGARG
jgi:glycosyltransferase involved in cell wall biosynthesis